MAPFPFFLISVSLIGLSAYGGPKGFQVLTFGGTSHLQATETILFKTSSGRLTTKEIRSIARGKRCEAYLSGFQKFPLGEMLADKYITRETYDRARTILPEQLDGRQLLLITSFVDLSSSELAAAFGDQVPTDRVLERPLGAEAGITRIAEGTIYVVRGQVLSATGQTRLETKRVPWELNVNRDKRALALRRDHIPMLVEFGRLTIRPIHADDSPLDQTMQLAFSILEMEADLLGFSADEVVVTSQFFDRGHHRLFLRGWPVQALTPALREALERDPKATMALPRESTEADPEGVVFGSLAQMLAQFNGRPISEIGSRMEATSFGRLSGQGAKRYLLDFFSSLRRDFDFVAPDGAISPRGPIQIRDRGTALVEKSVMGTLAQRFGVEIPNPKVAPPALLPFVDLIGGTYWNPEPDFLADGWVEPTYFIAVDSTRNRHSTPALEVSNLDPIQAGELGWIYSAALILSIADWVRSQGEDPSKFFDVTPLRIASTFSPVVAQLQFLGGIPIQAQATQLTAKDEPGDVGISIRTFPSYFYEFRGSAIEDIRRRLPQLDLNARERLRPNQHLLRLMLLNSAYQ